MWVIAWGKHEERKFSRECFPDSAQRLLWLGCESPSPPVLFLPNSKYQHSKRWAGFSHSRSALLTDLLMKWNFFRKKCCCCALCIFCLFVFLKIWGLILTLNLQWRCGAVLPRLMMVHRAQESDINITFTVAILSEICCLRSTVLLRKDRNPVFLDSSTSDIFLPMQMGQDGKRPN